VSNTAGSATSAAATLTVSAVAVAPTITTQPLNKTVTAGQTASFAVVATGTAPLTYQWQKSGINIAGATAATYTTPVTTTSDNGASFAAVVSNTAGSVTSAAATLTVNAVVVAPSITAQTSEPDGYCRTDGIVLRNCDGHCATELSVAKERSEHHWGDFGELYDARHSDFG